MIHSPLRRLVLACAFVFSATSVSSATPITLDFEGLTDSEALSNQFPGLFFSNALVVSVGGLLNDVEFPPNSGSNVITDTGVAITISFTQQVYSLAGYFTYVTPITLTAYDSANNVLGSVISAFSHNYQSSGTGSPNELLAFNSIVGISSISLRGDPLGNSFVLDDLTYDNEPLVGSVPDPGSTLGLVILAAAGMLAASRRLGVK